MFLQNITYASAIIAVLFVPRIRAWLSEVGQLHAKPSNPQTGQNICHAIEILIKSGSDDDRRSLEITARQRLAGGLVQPFSNFWLRALLHLDAVAGVEALERALEESTASKTGAGVRLFAELFHRDYSGVGVDLGASGFTPPILLRLLRLPYPHLRIGE